MHQEFGMTNLRSHLESWVHYIKITSKSNTSLHTKKKGDSVTYILVYVDDILITCNDEAEISSTMSYLNSAFRIKDLGRLN